MAETFDKLAATNPIERQDGSWKNDLIASEPDISFGKNAFDQAPMQSEQLVKQGILPAFDLDQEHSNEIMLGSTETQQVRSFKPGEQVCKGEQEELDDLRKQVIDCEKETLPTESAKDNPLVELTKQLHEDGVLDKGLSIVGTKDDKIMLADKEGNAYMLEESGKIEANYVLDKSSGGPPQYIKEGQEPVKQKQLEEKPGVSTEKLFGQENQESNERLGAPPIEKEVLTQRTFDLANEALTNAENQYNQGDKKGAYESLNTAQDRMIEYWKLTEAAKSESLVNWWNNIEQAKLQCRQGQFWGSGRVFPAEIK